MDINEIYDMMKGHLGYGNPKGKYWFIGMEEKCWLKDEIETFETPESKFRADYYCESIAPFEWSREEYEKLMTEHGQIHWGIAQIIERLEGIHNDKDRLLDYIAKNIFFCNVRFLPLKEKGKGPNVKSVFPNLTNEQIDADFKCYREKVGELWCDKPHGERITFLLSGSDAYINQFIETLGLDKKKKKQYWDNSPVCPEGAQNNQIYFLYHPRYGGFSKRLNEVIPSNN